MDVTVKEIDRADAADLLSALGLAAEPERLVLAAQWLARRRQQSMVRAAELIQTHIFRQFETEGPKRFQRESEDWGRGFNFAEELVVTATSAELLATYPEPEYDKGR